MAFPALTSLTGGGGLTAPTSGQMDAITSNTSNIGGFNVPPFPEFFGASVTTETNFPWLILGSVAVAGAFLYFKK